MENLKKSRPRVDYLDIAKAISIFLVMVGHAVGNNAVPYPAYRLILYTFHMPLFFTVSGVFVRRHQTTTYDRAHWMDFFRKNVSALVVPYFAWALIYSNFDWTRVWKYVYGSWEILDRNETLSSLWFLSALFTARILMELILMLSQRFPRTNRHLFAACASAPCFALTFLLPRISIGYPWCLNCAFGAAGFMLIGYSLKETIDRFAKSGMSASLAAFFICAAVFVFGILVRKGDPFFVSMHKADYGNPLLFFLNAFSGIGMVISFSILLSKLLEKHPESKARSALLWIGRSTFGVFVLHKPLLQQVVMPLLTSIGLSDRSTLVAILGAAITLSIVCLMIRLIEPILPQLFGKEPAPRRGSAGDPS